MTVSRRDLADVDPLVKLKGADETDGEFLRLEFTAHPSPDVEHAGSDLRHARWAADGRDEHINPKIEEFFTVLVGEYTVVVDGEERLLTEGDEITIPAGVPHRHYNPSAHPARIRYEARPAFRFEQAFESMFTLAQAGRTDEQGFPNILQFAVIQDAYPGLFFATDLPVSVQKVLFKLLAPVGRLLGYRATYSREDIADLQ